MPAPIVIGTDGSDEATRALDWAAAEAVLRERPLHIVHAIESWPPQPPYSARPETTEFMRRMGHAILATSRERARKRWPDLETATALLTGEPWQVLTEQSEKAFELVVGNRGQGGFVDLSLGSTSLRTAERSAVPVVIVRGDAPEGGEILVGIDPVRDASAILEYAFGAATLHQARLHVIHAWQNLATFIEVGYSNADQVEADLRQEVVNAYQPSQNRYPEVEVIDDTVLEHPVTALSKASSKAYLLVVGAYDWHWSSPQLGSVSHGVVHHAQCPVAVVPPR
ncbi:universal stress protein [Actinomadura sp. B10D3]|uniref:universal stress protein n=1 Tax=Actinomadura sp. B10D3 TaxID=3153557 RepID=UPI00325D9FAB